MSAELQFVLCATSYFFRARYKWLFIARVTSYFYMQVMGDYLLLK